MFLLRLINLGQLHSRYGLALRRRSTLSAPYTGGNDSFMLFLRTDKPCDFESPLEPKLLTWKLSFNFSWLENVWTYVILRAEELLRN